MANKQANKSPTWLQWASKLQAVAQDGLTFARDPFDIERYHAIRNIAAEMIASASDLKIEQILPHLQREIGYATPKVDVRGVVFQNEKILLVLERADHLWTLPGGWADVGESPSESVVREVQEEAGLEVRAIKLLWLYDRHKHAQGEQYLTHVYRLFFRCEIVGGTPAPGLETSEVGFFAQHEIPPLSTSRTTLEQIKRLFQHFRHPEWPTEFD